jgi:hypothetical protein
MSLATLVGPYAGPGTLVILTSTSATAVTNIIGGPCRLYSITSSGPQLTIFPTFYNDAAAVGAAATAIFGDNATIVFAAGQVISWAGGLPLVGLAYKLSGALGATQNLIVAVGTL